jgi:hypothetical protein
MIAAPPTIDNIPVALGDVVSGPPAGPFTNGRLKGWSPCGRFLYVGWLGVVPTDSAGWCCDLKESHFARLYRPATENLWVSEAICWDFAPKEALAA